MEALIVHLNFEVNGKVQGVFFRRDTVRKATALGLRGWVMNSPVKTKVVGEAEGPQAAIDQLKHWLRYEGSPKSRVERLVSSERQVQQYSFDGFLVRGAGGD